MSALYIIYQMGKVGSTAIHEALQTSLSDEAKALCFHTHFLSPDQLSREEQIANAPAICRIRTNYSQKQLQVVAHRLALIAEARSQGRPIKIITGVRDPFSHALSSFFQNLDVYVPLCRITDSATTVAYIVKSLRHLFLLESEKKLPETPLGFALAQNFAARHWFDWELKELFGIDIYTYPFDPSLGYAVCEKGNVHVFTYRLDKLAQAQEALHNFCQSELVQPLRLPKTNEGDEKSYANLYAATKTCLKLPEATVETLLRSRYTQFFFTEQERASLREKYLEAATP